MTRSSVAMAWLGIVRWSYRSHGAELKGGSEKTL